MFPVYQIVLEKIYNIIIIKIKKTCILAVYAGRQYSTAIYVQSDMDAETIKAPNDSKLSLNYSFTVSAETIHTLAEFHNIFCINVWFNTENIPT